MHTREELMRVLNYVPQTGQFIWSKTQKVAGSLSRYGYIIIKYRRCHYRSHRLAWLFMLGRQPVCEIDHMNTIRNDNKWVNLREASRKLNMQNRRRPHKNNTTGFLGVSKSPGGAKTFRACIEHNGTAKCIGTYKTPEAAYSAYVEAKRLLHEGCTI